MLKELEELEELCIAPRGAGLFVGVELVTDRQNKTPATETAASLVKR